MWTASKPVTLDIRALISFNLVVFLLCNLFFKPLLKIIVDPKNVWQNGRELFWSCQLGVDVLMSKMDNSPSGI